MYTHLFVGNKSLGETMTDLALAGLIEAPTVVTINTQYALAGSGDKILLITTKVLLYAAVSKLSK